MRGLGDEVGGRNDNLLRKSAVVWQPEDAIGRALRPRIAAPVERRVDDHFPADPALIAVGADQLHDAGAVGAKDDRQLDVGVEPELDSEIAMVE